MKPKALPIGKVEMPKIHGCIKVGIPSKEEAERMDMAGAYFHFNQRLNERYRIDITLDEYTSLRSVTLQVISRNKHKVTGIIKIKGIDVIVVKERHRKRKLITALPPNQKHFK